MTTMLNKFTVTQRIPEIRSNYFTLCNGLEFSVYRTGDTDKPILFFELENIETHWQELKLLTCTSKFSSWKKLRL
jgi:hypothetical protein